MTTEPNDKPIHIERSPSTGQPMDVIPHYGVVRDLSPKHETSHTEDWEITFRATVPAGLEARGPLTSAQSIIIQRMAEVLHQAGVSDPRVQARKVGRNAHRGDWEPGVEYAPGETVFEAGKLWMADKRNVNRPPHSNNGKLYGYWVETTTMHAADALFAPPKEIGTGHVEDWARQELADADIVDAEIVDE